MRLTSFLLGLSLLPELALADLRASLEPFLDQHCYACHDDFDNEGDLNLLDLKFDPSDSENQALWQKVFHRVEDGEMPPKKKKRPEQADLRKFLGALKEPLMKVDRAEMAQKGRVHSRRLSREEYEYSLHDLLGIDIPLGDYLTVESSEGFDSKAEAQQLSHFHLNGYLRAAGVALDEAFKRALEGDEKFKKVYSAGILASRRGRWNPRGPQFLEGKAIAWRANVPFYGRMVATRVPEEGWYRVTVKDLEAINPGPDGVVWGVLQSGFWHSSEALLYDIDVIEATAKAQTKSFLAWMRAGHILLLRPAEGGRKVSRLGGGGSVNYKGWKGKEDGYDGISFKGMNIERVYPNATRKEVREKLFFDLARKDLNLEIENSQQELRRLIQRFASIAFRRPVKNAELALYFKLASERFHKTRDFPSALKAAYHAVLCSPHFLTFVERPGKLDDHALAS